MTFAQLVIQGMILKSYRRDRSKDVQKDTVSMTQPWKKIYFTLPDGPATLIRWSGVPAPGPANEALFTAARRVEAERVFVAGPRVAASAVWAVRAGAHLIGWMDNIAEALSLKATFKLHNLPLHIQSDMPEQAISPDQTSPNTLYVQPDFAGLESGYCEMALIHLARGRALQQEIIQVAKAMLRPRGQLVFVGAKREGIKSAIQHIRAMFGQAGIVARKGGYHAGLAHCPADDTPLPDLIWSTYNIDVDDVATQLISCPGVFANDRLDGGAAALIAGMDIPPGARVLDLGCGTGLVGLAALRRGADVELADVSARAVATTRHTLAANGYPDAPVHLMREATELAAGSFDTVITNPPFHQGHGVDFEVAQRFITEAARVLKAGGKLYLVANAFLRYAPWLKASFSQSRIVWDNDKFCVWEGKGPHPRANSGN